MHRELNKLEDNLKKYSQRNAFGDENYMEMIASEQDDNQQVNAHKNSIKNDFYSMSEEMEDRPMVMGDRTNAELN